MGKKAVSILAVVTVKTGVKVNGFVGVSVEGPWYAKGIERLGTVGGSKR